MADTPTPTVKESLPVPTDPARFLAFIRELGAEGWQYADGTSMAADAAALLAQLEAARLDAARHQWLRERERWASVCIDYDRDGVYRQHRVVWFADECWLEACGQSADEAVDAAMAKQGGLNA